MIELLFRNTLAEENELQIAKKYFDIKQYRSEITPGALIIGRYSVLPYYNELEKDILKLGGKLINSYEDHLYIADIKNWYPDYRDITPMTWFDPSEAIRSDFNGSFVLKGNVNSRKQLFNTHMFAANKSNIMKVYCKLLDDTLIQYQGICVREFVNLINYGKDQVTGCPISKEFRLFILDGKVLSKGYYWSNFVEEAENPDPNEIPEDFIQDAIKRCPVRFFAIDLAQKTNGDWMVVELGDAQMAGPSCNDLDSLYKNLKENLCKKV